MTDFIFGTELYGKQAFGIFGSHTEKAETHIQNIAPGPPTAIAVATPTILPVPIVADMARHNALKLLISPEPLF